MMAYAANGAWQHLVVLPAYARFDKVLQVSIVEPAAVSFPTPLEAYPPLAAGGLLATLVERAQLHPFNAIATGIFLLAILHTFLARRFRVLAHELAYRYEEEDRAAGRPIRPHPLPELLHFLGEVEVVFGLYAVGAAAAITAFYDWSTAEYYFNERVNFTEPMFVVVIMTLAATGPILVLAAGILCVAALAGRKTPAAWWFVLLTVGPILGSLITEPAAMTIVALLLGKRFYARRPSTRLAYATLGLLFVNVSIGGTLTHFAAPPVLMVARPWGWDTAYMLQHIGLKALFAIVLSTMGFFAFFRKELMALSHKTPADEPVEGQARLPVPAWITAVHVAFVLWTVVHSHYPAFFIGGFLFFLGFAQATSRFQGLVAIKPAMLVGFFLAGLVVHGGLQAWWLAPALTSLSEVPLFIGAAVLTAFNDNALITYLATLVPNLSVSLKHAVVEGAVAGGGLTVIANAPNPAGQSILSRYFEEGISPVGLLAGAAIPTLVTCVVFLLLR